jgi:protein arginine kinase
MDLVTKVASQLNSTGEPGPRHVPQEPQGLSGRTRPTSPTALMKYAQQAVHKATRSRYLSQLMAGISDGLIATKKPCSLYKLVLGIQPSNLMLNRGEPQDKGNLDILRAEYIRRELPELKENDIPEQGEGKEETNG